MNITAYAEHHGGTGKRGCPILAQIAKRAECSPETLYMIAVGHKKPSGTLSRKLIEATNGDVTGADLRPDIFGRAPTEGEAANVA